MYSLRLCLKHLLKLEIFAFAGMFFKGLFQCIMDLVAICGSENYYRNAVDKSGK